MALTIIRTKDQLAISTAGQFTALDEIGSATVSTAAIVPSGVSSIRNIQVMAVNDGAEETSPVVLLSGNALPSGDTYQMGMGMGASNVGNSNYVSQDVDFPVISGNSLTISATSLDVATYSIGVILTLA
jgi:hypothetical protein